MPKIVPKGGIFSQRNEKTGKRKRRCERSHLPKSREGIRKELQNYCSSLMAAKHSLQ